MTAVLTYSTERQGTDWVVHQTVIGQDCSTRRLLDQSFNQLRRRESPVIPSVCVDVQVGMMCAHNSMKLGTLVSCTIVAEFRNGLSTLQCYKSIVTIKDNVHQICQLQSQTSCLSFAFKKTFFTKKIIFWCQRKQKAHFWAFWLTSIFRKVCFFTYIVLPAG